MLYKMQRLESCQKMRLQTFQNEFQSTLVIFALSLLSMYSSKLNAVHRALLFWQNDNFQCPLNINKEIL